jgi:hypothetical protein
MTVKTMDTRPRAVMLEAAQVCHVGEVRRDQAALPDQRLLFREHGSLFFGPDRDLSCTSICAKSKNFRRSQADPQACLGPSRGRSEFPSS